MIVLNEEKGLENLKSNEILTSLLLDYKTKNKLADLDFLVQLLKNIFQENAFDYYTSGYICSEDKIGCVYFDPVYKKVLMDSKILLSLAGKNLSKYQEKGFLIDEKDKLTIINILYSMLIFHETIHVIQYGIVTDNVESEELYKKIYGLFINRIINKECTLKEFIIYRFYQSKFVVEKNADCYALEIILEVLQSSNIISSQSLRDFINIYIGRLIDAYKETCNMYIGECEQNYRLLGRMNDYNKLIINPNIPLHIKIVNGLSISKNEFYRFKSLTHNINHTPNLKDL